MKELFPMVRSIKKMCRDEFGIRKRDKWNKLLVFIILYYVILFFNGMVYQIIQISTGILNPVNSSYLYSKILTGTRTVVLRNVLQQANLHIPYNVTQ